MKRIITISREFGSGGRELGRRLSELLQVAYYDKEIVTEIARRTSLSEEYVHQIIEQRPLMSFPISIGRSFYPMPDPLMEQNQAIYREQHQLIRELADKSDCVIVGRCGDYILRDLNPFRIFVYADMDAKIARCRERGKEDPPLTDKELKQQIKKMDKGRAKYYEFYTGQKWGDRLNYDICINTSSRSIKELASVLVRLIDGSPD
ncbi:MAG TPA: cytidylate kinase-like family protein [Candidatus Lachnoclostridium stercorigallinarum]|uniref:Cytidylate kinase-like family protein n=1 Tax=Candidatus Lachnoclostridium stercorigallinarum TaxID=2838634 RepID=A0A9D2GFF4_9FIRM|nr:cytidylate kinase-like family protein [Candidatus Lachnoclostridium stercorigallinarum]